MEWSLAHQPSEAPAKRFKKIKFPTSISVKLSLKKSSFVKVRKTLKNGEITVELYGVSLSARESLRKNIGDSIVEKKNCLFLSLRQATNACPTQAPKVQPSANDLLFNGSLQLDPLRYEAFVGGHQIDLTATQFNLLRILIERLGMVQKREDLLREVWGYHAMDGSRTVDTHVSRLRLKMGSAANLIEAVRGVGYRMIDCGIKP